MKFNYQARTKEGDIRSGQVEASSKEAATMLLQKHGFYVTLLESASLPIYARRIKFLERVSRKDIVMFSRELAIMFKSKVPLVESLNALAGSVKKVNFKEKLLKIAEEVEGGTSLSQALMRHRGQFSVFYISMIKSGEVSGTLSKSLEYLANHLEREYHLVSTLRTAMIYPILVLVVIVGIFLVLTFFVIPNLENLMMETGAEMPILTKIALAIANVLKQYFWLIGLLSALAVVLSIRYYRTQKGKRIFDMIILKMPQVGNLFKMIYVARFAENLSTLLAGGLHIAKALETTADVIGNTSYKEVIFETANGVRKGEPISSILTGHSDLFPPVFTQMVLVGEKTGSLDTTLLNIVDFYQQEVDRTIESLLSILTPLIILILGGIVTFLMLSVLIPLYQTVDF